MPANNTLIYGAALTILVVLLAAFRAPLQQSLIDCGLFRRGARQQKILAAFLVGMAFFMILNPEIRVLLLLIDAIGIDVLLALILIQLRAYSLMLPPLFNRAVKDIRRISGL